MVRVRSHGGSGGESPGRGEEGLSVELRKKDAGAPRGASRGDTLIFSASALPTHSTHLCVHQRVTSLPIRISFTQC